MTCETCVMGSPRGAPRVHHQVFGFHMSTLTLLAHLAQLPSYGYRSVSAYGAKPDSSDSTASFSAALTAAKGDGGGFVVVPAGSYTFHGTLVLPAGVSLRGANEYPYRSWGEPGGAPVGTTLLAYAGRANASSPPFLSLNTNSGIIGLSIFYPEQNASEVPVPYPPTIRGSGDNNAVRNVLLVNSYFGVDFATNACGRHLIDGLHGQPLAVGIAVDKCYDIGRSESSGTRTHAMTTSPVCGLRVHARLVLSGLRSGHRHSPQRPLLELLCSARFGRVCVADQQRCEL